LLQELKRDVIRSIIARCELLCEDLLQAEEEQGSRLILLQCAADRTFTFGVIVEQWGTGVRGSPVRAPGL